MKRLPAKLVILPFAGLAALALVCRSPEPDRNPSPNAELMAEGVPETVLLRLVARGQVARDVIAGRRTLLEAAALFGELNRLPPELGQPPPIASPVNIPADTEAGWLCRQVVEHVCTELLEEPERAAAAMARLEADFREE